MGKYRAEHPEIERFLTKHRNDPLIKVWPGQVRVTSVVTILNKEVFEITSNPLTAFTNSITGTKPTGTFLVYENKKGCLERVNIDPMPTGAIGQLDLEGKKDLGVLQHLLGQDDRKLSEIPRQKLVFALITLVYHNCIYDFPKVILQTGDLLPLIKSPTKMQQQYAQYLTRDVPISKVPGASSSFEVIVYYPISKSVAKYGFFFDSRGGIVSGACKFLGSSIE
jgi:hypothetical protein